MSAKKKRKKKRRGRGVGTVILTVFLFLFMVSVITVGVVAVTVLSDLKLISWGKGKPVEEEIAGVDYLDLDNYLSNQAKTTIIYCYDTEGNLIEDTRLHGSENRLIASLDEIPKNMINAVIALEDHRFRNHNGVDWYGTARSIVYDVTGKDMQGGSTITQQLIKNLTGENKRTLIRKYNEIKNALALERHFSKDEILEAYLNTIYLDQGCYGIKTGAEYYFGKDVSELTLMESAILASITQKPRTNNPILNYDNNRERAEICLYKMLENEMITQKEYDAALKEKVVFVGKKTVVHEEEEESELEVSTTAATEYQSWYTDFVIESVIKDLSTTYGYTSAESWRKVYYGGLSIYSAIDLSIQEQLDDVYVNRVTFPEEEDTEEHPAIQSAMVIMDYQGRILAMAGALGEKEGNRVLSYATGGDPRNPGSSIKPLSVYAPAIESGRYYWSSRVVNYGIMTNDGRWPKNYGGSPGSEGDMRMLPNAVALSLNTVPAQIVYDLTPEYCYSFLRDHFHLSTLVTADKDYAPLCIGDMARGATPLDMCAAYSTFGNGGVYYKPYCYFEVKDADGNVILSHDTTGQQALSSDTADVMNHLLQCPVTYSSGTAHGYGVDDITTFAKTGTSSDNYDKWIVGGTPYYVAATWVGYKLRTEIDINKFGTYPAAKVFHEVMNRIHEGLEDKDFDYEHTAIKREYCEITGLLAGSDCYDTDYGYYIYDPDDPDRQLPDVCGYCGSRRSEPDETILSPGTP